MEKLKEIATRFAITGRVVEISPIGNGLINDSYKLSTDGAEDYVMQRINHSVFRDVALLQKNIVTVTDHIRRKLIKNGETEPDRRVLRFIPLKNSDLTYCEADGKFWRMSVFIRDSYSFETVNPKYSRLAGEAFGNFEAMLADLEEPLGESIPDFHNMELRSRELRLAASADRAGRMSQTQTREILADLLTYEQQMCKAERMHRDGLLPKRICHCDSKVGNVLFDSHGEILCVIDLDTVMPSFVFSDFGDFLRTAGNTVREDDPHTGQVDFRMDIFKAFAETYVKATETFLTPAERDNLPFAACLFPYMQAVRFFADYLNGDSYYKIKYPEHNLVRTLNQIALFKSAMSKVPAMEDFLSRL